MKSVAVRDIVIGEGAPKICVPIVGVTREEILQEARLIAGSPADITEFRADYYDKVRDRDSLVEILIEIRQILGNTPLIVTLRTQEEGGCIAVSDSEYSGIIIRASRSGSVDLIDVQLYKGDELVRDIIENAHAAGVKVIVSSHDFTGTPFVAEIVGRLRRMQEIGADIVKIAVMPKTRRDVLTLLAAVDEMLTEYADRPVIAISMGEEGIVTRLAGEAFGSAVTFGCASRPSAPGQISAKDLKDAVEKLHEILKEGGQKNDQL